MILTRTPLRISLVGGGTDMPAFYKKGFGAVVSMAIDKYIYVGINSKFDHKTRISYSKTETVYHPMELKHDIFRESLLAYNASGIEAVSVADIPGTGTGLGSSSSLAVGLVRGLQKYNGESTSEHPHSYAERAYDIERNQCLHHVGKQDHYIAAYGNLHYFQFNPDGGVVAELLDLTDNERLELENRLVLLWSGRSRSATDILKAQEANMETERRNLAEGLRDMAVNLRDELRRKDFSNIGSYMDAGWKIKRQMAGGVTNEWIDAVYEKAVAAGAEGGKICGAGGGGFFVFYGKLGLAPALEKSTGLKHVPFKIDTKGCEVVYE